MLINNAGIRALPELSRTEEGLEMQFATNYLGHFALTLALHPALKSAGGARVVSVSSSGHLFSPVVFNDLDYRFRPYDPWTAYGQSKTAAVLLAVGVTDRWQDDQIVANALNPGAIATGLQKHTGGLQTPVDRRKNDRAGGCDLCAAGGVTASRRDCRALLRRLQRIAHRHGAPERLQRRRRTVCP